MKEPKTTEAGERTQAVVAAVMKLIEDRGYDLSDLGGLTCEEIAGEIDGQFPDVAAAPDMLEALRLFQKWEGEDVDCLHSWEEAKEATNAAIAKAERTQPTRFKTKSAPTYPGREKAEGRA